MDLNLAGWQLPCAISEVYARQGVTELFDWQKECLEGALPSKNFVFSAPTSGGKSIIAELLMLRAALHSKKKAVLVLPYLSIVSEKIVQFSELLKSTGLSVASSNEAKVHFADIIVVTIEKANSLLNRQLELNKIDWGLVVVDELHFIADASRGFILEQLCTKLLSLGINIVGMSATLSNIGEVANWLKADCYVTKHRPTELKQHAVLGSTIFNSKFQACRPYKGLPALVSEANSVLVFVASKKLCETHAIALAKTLELKETYLDPAIDKLLRWLIERGVAYHHGGMTTEERVLVERLFKRQEIKVLFATSTLAAGVNMPTDRVVVLGTKLGAQPISVSHYRQMIGRAGRTGNACIGESYLVVNPNERRAADTLMNSDVPPIESAIKNDDLNRLVLEAVVSQLCTTREQLLLFLNSTLLALQFHKDMTILLATSLEFLLQNDILTLEDAKYRSTHLGRSILATGLSPEEGLSAFLDMRSALRSLHLHNDLHLIYLGAPITSCIRVNWEVYMRALNLLAPQDQAMLQSLGVSQELVCCYIMDPPKDNSPRDRVLAVHLRFYQALVIYSLQKHQDTATLFGIDKGILQSFIRTAGCCLAMMSQFAAKLNWWPIHSLLIALRSRAEYVQHEELSALLRIPDMNLIYARVLYEHGYNSLGQVAKAPLSVLERIFQRACLPAPAAIAENVSISAKKAFARQYLRRSLRN